MTLNSKLRATTMQMACPSCKHDIVQLGSWFQSRSPFPCPFCGTEIRLTYSDKLALFQKYSNNRDCDE